MSLFPAVVVNDNSVGAFSGMPVMSIVHRQLSAFCAFNTSLFRKILDLDLFSINEECSVLTHLYKIVGFHTVLYVSQLDYF